MVTRVYSFSILSDHTASTVEYILISKEQFFKRLEGQVISLPVHRSRAWPSYHLIACCLVQTKGLLPHLSCCLFTLRFFFSYRIHTFQDIAKLPFSTTSFVHSSSDECLTWTFTFSCSQSLGLGSSQGLAGPGAQELQLGVWSLSGDGLVSPPLVKP